MTTQDPDRHKLPLELAQLVVYNTTERQEHRFFMTYEDWPRVLPYFTRLKREYPKLSYIGLDNGVYFGTEDRELEKLTARLMGVLPITAVIRAAADSVRHRPVGRPKGSQNVDYSFDELVRVGDSFLVLCEATYSQRSTLSSLCSTRNRQSALGPGPAKRFVTHKVDEGLLVVLVQVGQERPARVFRYGGGRD